MARLFGIIGNRPDLAARVLACEVEALRARSKGGAPLGWGIGFYQGGEVLMRRRPIDERQEIDVASLAADVRADLVIGHVRYATVGTLRTENTHPFRYRQWLFAQTGTVPEFEQVRDRLVGRVIIYDFYMRNVWRDFLFDVVRIQNRDLASRQIRQKLFFKIIVILSAGKQNNRQ